MGIDALKPLTGGFVWEYRDYILPSISLGIPLAIEAIALLRHPDRVKANLIKWKETVVDHFQRREGENDKEFRLRLLKNSLISIAALTALGLAAVAPFLFLAAPLAIPAALALIQLVGKAMINIPKIPQACRNLKDYLVDAFHQRLGESEQEFSYRRNQAIKRILLVSLIFAVSVASTAYGLSLAFAASQASSVWAMASVLPLQTSAVVMAEYLTVGILHLIQAIRSLMAEDKSKALFHLGAVAMSILFPLGYLLSPGEEMRLHHSFTGLLLMLAPSRSVQALGMAIVADSSLYFFYDKQGIGNSTLVTDPWGTSRVVTEQYDLMNLIYGNLPYLLSCLAAMNWVEELVNRLTKEEAPPINKTSIP
jgi:hypothetical protein